MPQLTLKPNQLCEDKQHTNPILLLLGEGASHKGRDAKEVLKKILPIYEAATSMVIFHMALL